MDQFIMVWLWPLLLLSVGFTCLALTLFPRFRRFHQLAEWRQVCGTRSTYWPAEWAHRSVVLAVMHAASVVIRCTSPLQYCKMFFKAAKPMGISGTKPQPSHVPAWLVEGYVLAWLMYAGLVAGYMSNHLGWFPPLLLAVVLFRVVHVVHGNLYYGLLRTMYFRQTPCAQHCQEPCATLHFLH